MTTLERWTDPRTIHVFVPAVQCEAEGCDRPRKADCVWNDAAHGQIHLVQICGLHLFLFRGRAPALFFPLDSAPPLEHIAAQMQAEIQRRNPPRVYVQMTGYGNFTGNFTGTGSYGNFYR